MPVDVSEERLALLAGCFKRGLLPPPLDFVHSRAAPYYPPRGAAWAAPFFFMAVKHLFGLWREKGGVFTGEIRGSIDGRSFIGEDFVWMALARTVQEDPGFLLPSGQAAVDEEGMARFFRADDGGCPVTLLKSHAELARGYGRALLDLKWTPRKILEMAGAAANPLHRFVELVSQLPGYREDPLQRKTFLLALILSGRPEVFLKASAGPWPPVLDRHALRLALRWGAVGVMDPPVQEALVEGRAVPPVVEEHVRLAAYDAFARLLNDSGRSVPETLGFFRGAREWCPEDRPPDCGACFFAGPCARRTELKSPVVRTMNY